MEGGREIIGSGYGESVREREREGPLQSETSRGKKWGIYVGILINSF